MVWLLLLLFLGRDWFNLDYEFSDPLWPTDKEFAQRELAIAAGADLVPWDNKGFGVYT